MYWGILGYPNKLKRISNTYWRFFSGEIANHQLYTPQPSNGEIGNHKLYTSQPSGGKIANHPSYTPQPSSGEIANHQISVS
ncbi:Uncharacterized protein APZ42_022214 [Daphnia magna]|uniref:Uncharacterized protein n=1 Tax=Daphnia magna TaxID=35525 RepID=A0A164W4K4_9CRUS|nr:Uncharacterized protein APZ42_022214 [Daphnia magna]